MYKEFISVMYIDKNPVTVQKCTHIIAAWAAFYQYLTALSMHTVSVRELSVNKVLLRGVDECVTLYWESVKPILSQSALFIHYIPRI